MFGGTNRRLLPALCAAALGAVAIAGCGGDDDESAAKDEQGPRQTQEVKRLSAAGESPKVFIERTARLLATVSAKKDCKQIDDVNRHSFSRLACPPSKELAASMESFKLVGVKEYGTGAVVDYRSGKVQDGGAILLFVAPDRKWGISRFGILTKPSTGTSDADSRAGYGKAVDAYLKAVRERDCKAFEAVMFTTKATEKSICGRTFAITASLAGRLKDNPSAKPKYLGGNATYGFYSIDTEKPVSKTTTISLVKAPAGAPKPYMVLDAAPSLPAEELARLRRAYEYQQKNREDNQPPTSPSRKAK